MKKSFLGLSMICFLLLLQEIKAQDVSLPLGAFRDYLMTKYPACFVNTDVNGYLMLNTACTAITTEDSLEFHNLVPAPPSYDNVTLFGIQYFTSLKYLNCSGSRIFSFSTLPGSLLYFNCDGAFWDTPFGAFPSLPAGLKYLNCANNSLGNIAFPSSLTYINCKNNIISNLGTLPPNLDTLICSGQVGAGPATNVLTSLPALPSTLKYLDCNQSALTSLPVLPGSLLYLDCSTNYTNISPENIDYTLSSLPALPSSLQTLKCSNNKLTSLPALPASLKYLSCSNNRFYNQEMIVGGTTNLVYPGISTLPGLPAGLEYLNCSGNNLTSLPTLPTALKYLDCSQNVKVLFSFPVTAGISSLDLSQLPLTNLNCSYTLVACLPRLPATLISLNTTSTNINCYPNSGSYTATPVRQLCSVINNSNQCVPVPVISGSIFYDNNSNGTKEANENYRPYVEVQCSNGQFAYSNLNGYFELSGDLGANSVNIIPPVYYNAVPASSNYTFFNYDTLVTKLYALQPTVSIDSVTTALIPYSTARPGFDNTYRLNYQNVGTTVVTSNITFNYDATRMSYSSASIAGVINNGSSLTIPPVNLTPGDKGSIYITFIVSPTTLLGDTIFVNTHTVSGTDVSDDYMYSVIRGSFDPNDKRATPKLTISEAVNGKYIDYLVRFQNTGTDTAFNVVVTDLLDNKLQANTFQIIDVSHPCRVQRTGSNASFEFINILLPDSNINERASHGYIRFRVKPLSTVVANTVIPNSVNIYFDYNAPVLTNIANTTINLTPILLKLLSFDGYADDEKNAVLHWRTENELNTRSFDIERSFDGSRFEKISVKPAIGIGSNAYSFKIKMQSRIEYFRLKMTDLDGGFSYSPIIIMKTKADGDGFVILSNPAGSILTVEVNDEALRHSIVSIFDNTGRVVHTFKINGGRQDIDLKHLPAGVYHLRTIHGTKRIVLTGSF